MRISDWSSDVCSSDLTEEGHRSFDTRQNRNGAEEDRHCAAQPDPGDEAPLAPVEVEGQEAQQHGQRTTDQNQEKGDAQRRDVCREQIRRRYQQPKRTEEHTSELQSIMRNSYAVLC